MSSERIIIITSSAGGLASLFDILRKLPDSFPVPVIVAQHIPMSNIPGLVRHLRDGVIMPVTLAQSGDELEDGRIFVSPTDSTLIIAKNGAGPYVEVKNYKTKIQPVIDEVIISAAEVFRENAILVVLSGLGDSGEKGAKILKAFGGKVIVESSATAAVFNGMPKNVIDSGYADLVLPSYEIAPALEKIILGEKAVKVMQSDEPSVKGLLPKTSYHWMLKKYPRLEKPLSEAFYTNFGLNGPDECSVAAMYPVRAHIGFLKNAMKITGAEVSDLEELGREHMRAVMKVYVHTISKKLFNPKNYSYIGQKLTRVLTNGVECTFSVDRGPDHSETMNIVFTSAVYESDRMHVSAYLTFGMVKEYFSYFETKAIEITHQEAKDKVHIKIILRE